MTQDEILERVSAVVGEILEVDDLVLTAESVAPDVDGWDSITTVEIMVALEQDFGFRFRTGEIAAFKNMGDLADRIAAHVAS